MLKGAVVLGITAALLTGLLMWALKNPLWFFGLVFTAGLINALWPTAKAFGNWLCRVAVRINEIACEIAKELVELKTWLVLQLGKGLIWMAPILATATAVIALLERRWLLAMLLVPAAVACWYGWAWVMRQKW